MDGIELDIQLRCIIWFLSKEGEEEHDIVRRITKVFCEQIDPINLINVIVKLMLNSGRSLTPFVSKKEIGEFENLNLYLENKSTPVDESTEYSLQGSDDCPKPNEDVQDNATRIAVHLDDETPYEDTHDNKLGINTHADGENDVYLKQDNKGKHDINEDPREIPFRNSRKGRYPNKPKLGANLTWVCRVDGCKATYADKAGLSIHMKRVHSSTINGVQIDKKFICDKCQKYFMVESELIVHQQKHRNGTECTICGKILKWKLSFDLHMKMHQENPHGHQCGNCEKTFLTTKKLRCHANIIHLRNKPVSKPKPIEMKTEKIKSNITQLKPKICEKCGILFPNYLALKYHKQKIHKVNLKLKCTECTKTYKDKYNLNQHLRSHNRNADFVCDICAKVFVYQSSLWNHKKTHTGIKEYACDLCGKSFYNSTSLKFHLDTHSLVNLFTCSYDGCGKGFKKKFSKVNHEKVHNGYKPYKCDTCEKKFKSHSAYRYHLSRIHVPIKKSNDT